MAIPARTARPGTFFVTSATFNRRRIFRIRANAQLFIETLQHYRSEGHFKLYAFVVMPDHVHFLITPQGVTLERVVQLIKGGFSHKLGSNFPVWQKSFTDHRIRNRQEFDTRVEYINMNPVMARMVERPELYEFSSAFRPPAENHALSG
jgi:putative transposase